MADIDPQTLQLLLARNQTQSQYGNAGPPMSGGTQIQPPPNPLASAMGGNNQLFLAMALRKLLGGQGGGGGAPSPFGVAYDRTTGE